MLHLLKRHPIPIQAWFEDSLVLVYGLPQQALTAFLPPGLELDCHGKAAFLAIAMVQTKQLRPAGLPRYLGQDFFLSGYRIFTRFTTRTGRRLRGLRILRSDTDHRMMASVGNCLTHYNYQFARVRTMKRVSRLEIEIATPDRTADLHVVADLKGDPLLPENSPFANEREARRFAGPLPYTFDYEAETNSMVVIEGVRRNWKPRLVKVEVLRNTFLERFHEYKPILASAFHVSDIPYLWKRGVREPLHAL